MIKLYRVGVKFRDPWEHIYCSKTYHYYSAYKMRLDDIVIVESRYGPQVAKVVQENIPSASFTGSSFVIQKVDVNSVNYIKEKLAKAEMLKEEIEERVREALFTKQVEDLSAQDEELAQLLDQLKNI